MQSRTDRTHNSAEGRKPYARPTLRTYGNFKQLTEGSMGGAMDSGSPGTKPSQED